MHYIMNKILNKAWNNTFHLETLSRAMLKRLSRIQCHVLSRGPFNISSFIPSLWSSGGEIPYQFCGQCGEQFHLSWWEIKIQLPCLFHLHLLFSFAPNIVTGINPVTMKMSPVRLYLGPNAINVNLYLMLHLSGFPLFKMRYLISWFFRYCYLFFNWM